MSEHLKLAEDFFRRGRYADALEAARRATPLSKAEAQSINCLICECLQFTGAHSEALQEAKTALESQTINATLTARYWGAIGRVRFDENRREEAAEAFSRGMRALQRTPDLATLSSLQHLWLISASGVAPAAMASSVRDAYRTAIRSGDPVALASFHVRLAQLEGQRGSFANAAHHLDLAESLLDRVEHVALRGIFHVNRGCVLGLIGAYAAARKNGEAAALYAEQAGYARLSMAASAVVAHTAVAVGDLSVAESWLRRGIGIMRRLGIIEGSLFENLASVELIRGRIDNAKAHLANALHPVEDPKWTTAGDGYTLLTELHLHKVAKNAKESQRVLTALHAIGGSQGDKHLQLLTALGEVEFMFDQAAHLQATTLLVDSSRRFPSQVIYQPDLNRMAARYLWLQGYKTSARRRLLRACSAGHVRGTRLTWAQSLREYQAADGDISADEAYSVREQSKHAQSKFPALMQDNDLTWFQRFPDPPGDRPRTDIDGFDDAVAVLELTEEPELRAREALATAIALDVTFRAALLKRNSAGLQVVATHRWAAAHVLTDSRTKSTTEIRIEITADSSRTYELILEPKNELRAVLVVNGLRRLLEAANALHSLQKDRQRLGALWQPEIIIEEPGAVFSSPPMIELMHTARKVAATTLPVLLLGDTGTGKEVMARAIHRASPRANRIFLPFNCSAVPRDMIESQLFGYRRGSFTGANSDFPGIIRSAEGGTLFLDEIGELSIDLQPKLLRFLETNEVHPIGEGKPIKVDVRIIAATNADLDELVQSKEFREDLYYRLNIVRFHMPVLSERREEVPPLVMHLLRRFEMDEKKHSISVSDELMEYFLLYRWPGNIRQLSNELRKMVAMVESGETLTPDHLSPAIRATRRTVAADPDAEPAPTPADAAGGEAAAAPAPAPAPAASEAPPAEAPDAPAAPQPEPASVTLNLDQQLHGAVEALERAMIEHAIARADGRIEEAARLLGISRKGLFLKRRRWQSGGDPAPPAS